jgi:hypothetical protein
MIIQLAAMSESSEEEEKEMKKGHRKVERLMGKTREGK